MGHVEMPPYSISWQDRNELVYAEGDRTLTVDVEDGLDRQVLGPVETEHRGLWYLIVYVESIRKWDDGQPIGREERDRILKNISEALTTAGTRHKLE